MDNYQIIITDHAYNSILEICDYIANDLLNPSAAQEHLNVFRRVIIENLAFMPERYKTIDEEPWGSQGVRKLHVKNYYIYYWINCEKHLVFVTDVIYAGSNQEKWLFYMPMQ